MLPSILDLQSALAKGETTSLELTNKALARTLDASGQGHLVFTQTYQDQALAAAKASDQLRSQGLVRSPLEGLPVSVKDLFDVAGQPTWSGSKVLKDVPVAKADAVAVQHLRSAGSVITGKTNMVEFAYSGLGINPHYGTPVSPWDKESQRIPGGSSSGSGVAVAEEMSVISIGSDTGGSIRIPSAFCGITGFKPTARRVSAAGVLPLSTSLDSLGGLCPTVTDCIIVDDIVSGDMQSFGLPDYTDSHALLSALGIHADRSISGLRFLVPENYVFDRADDYVLSVFDRVIDALKAAGAQIYKKPITQLDELAVVNPAGGLIASEAWAWHRSLLASNSDEYDPRVLSRIIKGKDISAADYIDLQAARKDWVKRVENAVYGYDAILMPTVPIIAPKIADLDATDKAYFSANGLILRNNALVNLLDGCALSIPCHENSSAPVGLMVAGTAMQDKNILGIGLAIESVLSSIS